MQNETRTEFREVEVPQTVALIERLQLERVNEVADYIAEDDAQAARLFLIDIFGAVARLESFPNSGRIVPEVKRPNIREIIFGNYRVVYRVERKRVSILTVRHGKQRLPLKEIT